MRHLGPALRRPAFEALTNHNIMALIDSMSRPLNSESVFRAIAHPARRRILQLVRGREVSAGGIAKQFKHSQPVTSRHLRVLHASGLISMRTVGVEHHYRLDPRALAPISSWLKSLQSGGSS